ncbi:hypothetical protein BH11GEM1_BH11GEM1_16630 [soil metagenome]
MLTDSERESFALEVMDEVRRWPGVEMRPHPSADTPGSSDGVEFRLSGRQIGHLHSDCAVHLSLTRALKESVIKESLAEALPVATSPGWTMFNPMIAGDVERAIWLLRLNYVRLRRQRLTPLASANSELLQRHEAALGSLSAGVSSVLRRTQARVKPRPLPELGA